jgi:photosystem II stability/assembly factor-like uncharacterized protein
MKTKKLLLIMGYSIISIFSSQAYYGYCLKQNINIGYTAHKDSVKVYSDVVWNASCDADWLTVLTESGTNEGFCVFQYEPNDDEYGRYTYITFSGENVKSWRVFVEQFGNSIVLWEYSHYLLADDWGMYNTQLNKVYAHGLEKVYVVGDNGFFAQSNDKAARWQKCYLPYNVNLNDVIFCNEETGYIIGDNGTILKTTNSGNTWQQINIPYGQNLHTIASVGINNLWIVGDESLILHSTDGGETWTRKNILSENKNLYDIKFKNDIGYITGEQGCILKTENQGVDWEDKSLPSLEHIRSLSITDTKAFVLSFPHPEDRFNNSALMSEDGELWSEVCENGRPIHGGVCINFTDDNQGFKGSYGITTGNGYGIWLNKTTDGGNSWVEMSVVVSKVVGWPSSKGNFSFSENNEFAYFLCGQILLRAPYTGELTAEADYNNITQPSFHSILNRNGDDLQIIHPQKTISSIQILSISGTKIRENYAKNHIQINTLPNGIYLIRVRLDDNTNEIVKWIKK